MTKPLYFALLGALLLTLAVGGFLYVSKPSDPFLLQPSDRSMVAKGAMLYAGNCASCHGAALEGEPDWRSPDEEGYLPAPPHDETGHTWHQPDEALFGLTKFGIAKYAGLKDHKSNMPAYEGVLSDADIIAVLSFIKSTWPDDVKAMHDQRNAIAAERKEQ